MAYDRWSTAQKSDFLFKLPYICGPLSVMGSLLVLLALYRNKSPHRRVYHRLMAGMSIMDLFLSVAWSFGNSATVSHPAQVFLWGTEFGNGTQQTCSLQAFFIQLGFLSYTYMMFISMFFVLKIRYNYSDETLAKYVEPVMHLIPWTLGIVSASVLVGGGYSNFSVVTCWIGSWPPACNLGFFACERGDGFLDLAEILNLYPSIINMIGIGGSLAIVSWTVFQKYRQSGAFRAETGWSSSNDHVDEALKRSTRSVVVQCTLYIITFLNSSFWFGYANWLIRKGRMTDFLGKLYFVLVLNIFFFPLQGFFNFVIFVRAPFVELRARQPSLGRWQALKIVIWNGTTATEGGEWGAFRSGYNARSSGEDTGQTGTASGGQSGGLSGGSGRRLSGHEDESGEEAEQEKA